MGELGRRPTNHVGAGQTKQRLDDNHADHAEHQESECLIGGVRDNPVIDLKDHQRQTKTEKIDDDGARQRGGRQLDRAGMRCVQRTGVEHTERVDAEGRTLAATG